MFTENRCVDDFDTSSEEESMQVEVTDVDKAQEKATRVIYDEDDHANFDVPNLLTETEGVEIVSRNKQGAAL